MSKTKKADNDKLAKGAADIKKAQGKVKSGESTPPAHVDIPAAKRDIREVLSDRVIILPGHIGIKLAEGTQIEETFQVLDWASQMKDHVGFMIGDVINFGNGKWGDTYKAALNQTGRAYSTLAGYAETARRIPADQRKVSLSFTHHRELIRLPDEKLVTVLKEVGDQADKGNEPSVQEIRTKVMKLTPRPRKKAKKATSGKKGKAKVELPPYEPTSDEQSKLDVAEEAIGEAADSIKTASLFKIVGKLDNKEKRRWLTLCEPIVTFYNAVDHVTGY